MVEWGDVATWVGGVGGLIGGIGGACAARFAYLAHKRAEEANTIAKDAKGAAVDANNIAEQSNQLARDANTIAERAVAAASDDVEYLWRVRADDETHALVVLNKCAHDAHDVTIIVAHEDGIDGRSRFEHIPAFSEVHLDPSGALAECIELASTHRFSPGGLVRDGRKTTYRIPEYTMVSVLFTVDIIWTTDAGKRRVQKLKELISYRNSEDGVVQGAPE